MSPKAYLSQIERLNALIQQRIQERDDIRRRLGLSGVDYTKPIVQTSAKPEASFTRTVERFIELEKEIDKLIDCFVTERNKIIGEIQQLDDLRYVKLLYKRYVEFKQFECIATEMFYTYFYVIQMHGTALLVFGEKFPDIINL